MSRWEIFVRLILPATVLAAGATAAVCVLKRQKVWSTIGLVTFASAAWLMIWSWSASSESFEDVGIAVLWLLWAVPLLLVTLVGTLRPARPGSWWERRRR